jgi:hypothetical protein
MRNNYSTLSNTYNIKTDNQTYTDPVCTDRASCSNNGVCLNGACVCDSKFWSGDRCQTPFCTDSTPCSNCTDRASCSNNGDCKYGQCICDTVPYVRFGDNCEQTDPTIPPCNVNEGWFWNPSYENKCVYKCTKDGQYPSNPDNNNNNAYKYVQAPDGSHEPEKCYRIFDHLDHDSRKDACYTDFNPLDPHCQYNGNSKAIGVWKSQGWAPVPNDECAGWPDCKTLLNPNPVVAVNNNPIQYFNPVYYYDTDSGNINEALKWGEPNEKGIGYQTDGDWKKFLDINYPYPQIPTS